MKQNPLVKIPKLLPASRKILQLRRNTVGAMRSFDTIHWQGTPYGTEPQQCLDITEVNDLCPRDGWPSILMIHGGGWIEGDKMQFRSITPIFAKKKIMAVSMNYRLAPQATWQEQIDDVLKALAFLRSQQVDLQRIALWGTSAGAHLALMAATQVPEQIRCVVTIGAPTDLSNLPADETREVFTTSDLNLASPLHQINRLPPTLMLHGEKDPVIPVAQSRDFAQKHGNVEYWELSNGDHHLRWPLLQGWQMKERAIEWVVEQMDLPKVGSKWKRNRYSKKK